MFIVFDGMIVDILSDKKNSIDSNRAPSQKHENNHFSSFYHIIFLCSTKNILEKLCALVYYEILKQGKA